MARNDKVITMPGSRGKNFVVCWCHHDHVAPFKWHILKTGYVARTARSPKRMIYLHRFIARVPKGQNIDHRDGNPLNNVCWNLRVATQHDNIGNSSLSRKNTSGHKGVAWHKQAKKWRAYISHNRKQVSLGLYDTVEEAAAARRIAAAEKWGLFSNG